MEDENIVEENDSSGISGIELSDDDSVGGEVEEVQQQNSKVDKPKITNSDHEKDKKSS